MSSTRSKHSLFSEDIGGDGLVSQRPSEQLDEKSQIENFEYNDSFKKTKLGTNVGLSQKEGRGKRRVVSLDSSLVMKREGSISNIQMRAHSSGSMTAAANNVMQRLDFEAIEVGNTPLSSLRSCSEFNRYNSSTGGNKNKPPVDENKAPKKSLISRLFSWRKGKSPSKVYTKKLDADEQLFILENLRPTTTFDSSSKASSYTGSSSFITPPRPTPSINQTFEYRDSKLSDFVTSVPRHSRASRYNSVTRNSVVSNRNTETSMVYVSTSMTLDLLFGIHNRDTKRYPMEIELKTLTNTRGRTDSYESLVFPRLSSYHSHATTDDDVPLVPMTPRLSESRGMSFSIPDSAEVFNEADDVADPNAQQHTGPQSTRNLLPVYRKMLKYVAELCTKYVLGRDPVDSFYDAIRMEPFGAGTYLRGLLSTGLIGMVFNAYNIMMWPDLPVRAEDHIYVENFMFTIVLIQLMLHLCLLPVRLTIHLQCWESSRSLDLDAAVATLHNMMHCDNWICNRGLTRLLDFLSVICLVVVEIYLWVKPNGDVLRGLFVSLAATHALGFIVRLIISALFSLSAHDPEVLSEARRRGLSRLDLDSLPSFVFTSTNEVNNVNCPICLCNFEMGEMLIPLPCDKKHSFHAACIRQWLQRQNSCPLCQKMV